MVDDVDNSRFLGNMIINVMLSYLFYKFRPLFGLFFGTVKNKALGDTEFFAEKA